MAAMKVDTRADDIVRDAAAACDTHPYLVDKKVSSHERIFMTTVERVKKLTNWHPAGKSGLLRGRLLVVPLRSFDAGDVRSILFIDEHGCKSYLKGASLDDVAWCSDDVEKYNTRGHTIFICEGIATALTLLVCGSSVVVSAGGQGRLVEVAKAVRKLAPKAHIVIAADAGAGYERAIEAAGAVNGVVTVPNAVLLKDGGDFNDMMDELGDIAVMQQVRDAVALWPLVEGRSTEQRDQRDATQSLVAEIEVHHSSDGYGYVILPMIGGERSVPIQSKFVNSYVRKLLYDETGRVPRKETVSSAVDQLIARALYEGEHEEVCTRVGNDGPAHCIDLAGGEEPFVMVEPTGWRTVMRPSIRFAYRPSFLPLPTPERGGSIDLLRRYINLPSGPDGEASFALIVSWMLMALRSDGPYPVLCFLGEQGSSKSFATEVVRSLIDPNRVMLSSLPRSEQDHFISAHHQHVVAFDNVSSLSAGMSDALCRTATGGGFRTRQLFSDSEEVLFSACLPVVMNGIVGFIQREDLIDRSIVIELDPIHATRRVPMKDLRISFAMDAPKIFGALLDGFAHGLANTDQVEPDEVPRMADFAEWAAKCETAYWKPGTVAAAYTNNIKRSNARLVYDDPVGAAVMQLVENTNGQWRGTTTDLSEALWQLPQVQRGGLEPVNRSAVKLGHAMQRLKPALERLGVEYKEERVGSSGTRTKTLTKVK